LETGNSLIISPAEFQCLALTLVFTTCSRTRASSILLWNLSCYVFFKYRSAHIDQMFMLCLLQNWACVYG